jgi:hypothetical protein
MAPDGPGIIPSRRPLFISGARYPAPPLWAELLFEGVALVGGGRRWRAARRVVD